MKIYSVDFEKVVKNYKNYVSKMLDQEQIKINHQSEIEVFKKEMESILASANSGLIVDENIQKEKIQRFRELTNITSKIENDFRSKFTETNSLIMESSFEEVSEIINGYANSVGIDMIVSKSQLVFVNSKYDITNHIIDILKDKDMYYEVAENEKEIL